MAEVTSEDMDALANVPLLDELPQEVLSVLAWQAKTMPELFKNAFPDKASLELRDRVQSALMSMILSLIYTWCPDRRLWNTSHTAQLAKRLANTQHLSVIAVHARRQFVRGGRRHPKALSAHPG